MNSDTPEPRSLREIEMEVQPKAANGCANGFNKSFKLKLTATAEFFPHSGRKAWHRRSQPMPLRPVVGVIELSIWQGQDPQDGHWGCPIRERWGGFYLQEQAAHTQGGRGSWREDDGALARWALWNWEAAALGSLRGGLGRAKERLVLGDGSAWIWNVAADRWSGAHELLDFYHGSEHLWGLGRALCKDDEVQTRGWVEPRLHELRHGREQKLLKELAALTSPQSFWLAIRGVCALLELPYALAAFDLAFGERDAFRHGRLFLAAG